MSIRNNPDKCYECGVDVASMDRETFLCHMVNEHKFKREGNTVYKPKVCMYCPNTALYRVSSKGYCKEHYKYAVDQRKHVDRKYYAPVHAEISADLKQRDRIILSKNSLHKVKKGYDR